MAELLSASEKKLYPVVVADAKSGGREHEQHLHSTSEERPGEHENDEDPLK